MKITASARACDRRETCHCCPVARGAKAVARGIAVALWCFAVTLPGGAEACGWGGEDWDDEDIEEIAIGPDGEPLAEDDDWPSDPAAQTRLGNRYRNGQGLPRDLGAAVR